MKFKIILFVACMLVGGVVADEQQGSTYGLDRVSHQGRDYDSNGPYSYLYNGNPTKRVTVYVIDTGTTPNHVDFGGRSVKGKNFA